MAKKLISQRSIVAIMRVFNLYPNQQLNYAEILYEHNFPDWFVIQATNRHGWVWSGLFIDLRRGTFCFARDSIGGTRCIVPYDIPIHTEGDAAMLGEYYIQRLAAFATTLPGSEELTRSLQLDGFDVDKVNWQLVPLEGPVSAQEEEGRLTRIVKTSGLPRSSVILKHTRQARHETAGADEGSN